MNKKLKILMILNIFFLFFVIGCKQNNIRTAIVDKNFYAQNFSYSDHEDHIKVRVNAGGSEYIRYLYREDSFIANNKTLQSSGNRIIQYVKIPVQRIISLSAENIFFLESLDSLDALKAIDLTRNTSHEKVKELVKKGYVTQTGEGRDIDIEMIYSIDPDLIFTSWTGGDYDSVGILLRHGFPVAVTAGWLESHPLGRAEWLVFLSLFLDMEYEGKNIFSNTIFRYNSLKASVPASDKKPVVLVNMVYGDSWIVPSGESYFAIMLEHAGAAYPWASARRQGSLFFDFEQVFIAAHNADIWLLNTQGIRTSMDILNKDRRYSLFNAFQNRRIYNNDLEDRGEGNPFWDEGTAYPDRILSDLISIIHQDPDADNGRKHFFRRVE